MTMHYEFPCIQWWHTVSKHFEGNQNFIIVDKGEYFVVNYVRASKETHPPIDMDNFRQAIVLREARGLIFCSQTGELLSRPFHKFFNLGEREDVNPDFSKPHYIVEKLDGSMVRPIPLPSGIRWGTKMGITDVSMQAEQYVANNSQYQKFAEACIQADMTPLFEWCSRKQRIVIDYPEDQLVLLAVRNNFTGSYIDRRGLEALGKLWNVPVVQVREIKWEHSNEKQLQESIRHMTGIEGVVVQFCDGHIVKIKTDEYVQLHRAKSLLENERDVIGIVLDEKTDDLMAILSKEESARLEKFANNIWYDILQFQTRVNAVLREVKDNNTSRKDFALLSANMDPQLRAACFNFFVEGNCNLSYIVDVVRKNLGSKGAFEKLRSILRTASWKEIKIDQ